MANGSDVYGIISLVGDWTTEMIKNLNIIKKEWNNWSYYTDVHGDFNKNELTLDFSAIGRWSYDVNLREIGAWITENRFEETEAAYKNLCGALKLKIDDANEPTVWIEVDFKEHEPGCCILRECSAKIKMQDNNLVGHITNKSDYEYTAENLVELGFHDIIEEAQELFEETEDC